ncbi:MAG: pirin family protein [Pseudomonadota bacterium]
MALTRRHDALIWRANAAFVGPVQVRRSLPAADIQSIGPIVFLDHFGPVDAPEGKLPAHPHAGIEVMTYLLQGANEHTDSQGHVGQIADGGTQWMRAGAGILHAERNLIDRATTMHGLQIWARLPIAEQDAEPAYRAFQASDMPTWRQDGADIRLLSGALRGHAGLIPLALPSLMAHVRVSHGSSATITLPHPDHEYGVYTVSATDGARVDRHVLDRPGLAVRLAADAGTVLLTAGADQAADFFLFGGEPAPQPLVYGGPFVLDSEAAIAKAQHRYEAGEMGTLDGVPF